MSTPRWFVDPLDSVVLAEGFLAAHFQIVASAMLNDRSYEPAPTRPGADEWLQVVSSPERRFLLWSVRDASGLAGFARLSLPEHENSDHAQIEIRVELGAGRRC
ncbi:hypothetical protein [Actinoplanes sp. NPDC051859]|uniref:hypothetical protein n=1 Tax=Actinoplanes sp. NPDC051859 TaxID=3363909 RepID=UPI0037AFF138